MKRPAFRVKVARDTILFTVGLMGIAYETVVEHADRPTLLLMFGAMVGLPSFLGRDAKVEERRSGAERRSKDEDDE